MKKISFGFFDDSGQPRGSRILMFYSFETEESLARSGILHYHLGERRFVGPRHDPELTERRARVSRAQRPAGDRPERLKLEPRAESCPFARWMARACVARPVC